MREVVLVTNIPTPYRIPLFNELSAQLGERGIGLTVVFGAGSSERRKWEIDMSDCSFRYVVLRSGAYVYRDGERSVLTYSGLMRALRRLRPGLVIVGGFSLAALKVRLYSFLARTPYIIWSGAIAGHGGGESRVRRLERAFLVRGAAGFVSYGSMAKDYLVSLGADPGGVQIAINTVDTGYYGEAICNRLTGAGGPFRLLYVGHLTQRKNVAGLLRVMKALADRGGDIVLDVVGEGPERPGLERFVGENGLGGRVVFQGFRQKADVRLFLGCADCFVFPTDFDIWGLVLVEAMAAGLPCVCSMHAGAARDLIVEGETGFVADFSDAEAVAERVLRLREDRALAVRMGQSARRFIEMHATIKESASGFVRAIERAMPRTEAIGGCD